MYGFIPYSQVYMTSDVVDALRLQMLEPEEYEWIVNHLLEGMTESAIVTLYRTFFGETIEGTVVGIIAAWMYNYVSTIDYWSLKSAQDLSSAGKVF